LQLERVIDLTKLHPYPSSLLVLEFNRFYKEGIIIEKQKRKTPKGRSESPWSLHIECFWKIHFINPPEVQVGLSACSFKGRTMTETKYQNPPFGSIGKCQESCHCLHLPKIQRMESISKPCSEVEIYTFLKFMSTKDFRADLIIMRIKTSLLKSKAYGNRLVGPQIAHLKLRVSLSYAAIRWCDEAEREKE
jgi:hypothetical protein